LGVGVFVRFHAPLHPEIGNLENILPINEEYWDAYCCSFEAV
jgi:hypothetical protein